jgi:hypothetical protein
MNDPLEDGDFYNDLEIQSEEYDRMVTFYLNYAPNQPFGLVLGA